MSLDLAAVAGEVIKEMKTPSRSWINGFLEGTHLKLKSPEAMEAIRFKYVTTGSITHWFEQHGELIRSINPMLAFNFDEIMLSCDERGKVISNRNRSCFSIKQPRIDHVTVGITINAVGKQVPPLIILKNRKKVPKCMMTEFLTKQVWIGSTEKGWSNRTIFAKWVVLFAHWLAAYRLELPEEVRTSPALLFLDAHSSRASVEALEYLKSQNIILLTFPSHHTHVLQMIDVVIARSFKAEIKKEVRIQLPVGCSSHTAKEYKKILLLCIVTAVQKSCTNANAKRAFSTTGLFPFDPTKPLSSPYVRSSEIIYEQLVKEHARGAETLASSLLTSDELIAIIANRFRHDSDSSTRMFS